jgi:ABC-type spermidine/putrescine transport system permease subunit II
MESQAPNVLTMVHLIMLSLWGGVVATESVIELYPFRKRELHSAAIRFHYWIDLLVELPLVLAVIATGAAIALSMDQLSGLHWIKILFGATAVAINLFCIVVVVRRGRQLDRDAAPEPLWRASRIVLACFATGLLAAAGAATLGFRFALDRLG